MFDLKDPAGILLEINACRKTFPQHYIRVTAFDSTRGWETVRMSFIVNRPKQRAGLPAGAPGSATGAQIRYTVESYAARRPEGERY